VDNTTGFCEDNVGDVKNSIDSDSGNFAIVQVNIEVPVDEGGIDASNDAFKQVVARNILVENFRESGEKKRKVQKTSKTVKYLHETFSAFKALVEDCQVEEAAC
jgi:ribosomal protein S9